MQYITKNFPSFITNKQQDVFFEINDIVKIVIKDKKYFKYKAKYQKELHGRISEITSEMFYPDPEEIKKGWNSRFRYVHDVIKLDITEKYNAMIATIRIDDIEKIELIEKTDDYINITWRYHTTQWLRNKILQKLKRSKN